MPVTVCAIAAMDESRVIGHKGKLPWHIPEDLKHFSDLTKGHAVLMGRKTWESLPERYRPLPQRKNIVISRTVTNLSGAEVWESPEKCIQFFRSGKAELPGGKIWIIGGAEIYRLTASLWDEVYLTLVKGCREGDAFFPPFEEAFSKAAEEDHGAFSFQHYVRRQS